jgi:hypothetical protein
LIRPAERTTSHAPLATSQNRGDRRATCTTRRLRFGIAAARFVIEMAPVRDAHGERRDVVAEGSVGLGWAGRARMFRYALRCWRDGQIPDVGEAVGGPRRVTEDRARA